MSVYLERFRGSASHDRQLRVGISDSPGRCAIQKWLHTRRERYWAVGSTRAQRTTSPSIERYGKFRYRPRLCKNSRKWRAQIFFPPKPQFSPVAASLAHGEAPVRRVSPHVRKACLRFYTASATSGRSPRPLNSLQSSRSRCAPTVCSNEIRRCKLADQRVQGVIHRYVYEIRRST